MSFFFGLDLVKKALIRYTTAAGPVFNDIIFLFRNSERYVYSPLNEDIALYQKMDIENQMKLDSHKSRCTCLYIKDNFL